MKWESKNEIYIGYYQNVHSFKIKIFELNKCILYKLHLSRVTLCVHNVLITFKVWYSAWKNINLWLFRYKQYIQEAHRISEILINSKSFQLMLKWMFLNNNFTHSKTGCCTELKRTYVYLNRYTMYL